MKYSIRLKVYHNLEIHAYLKGVFDCFIDKSLLKCLVVNDNVNNAYLMMSRFKLIQFSSRQFFGLIVSPTQQRLNLRGCNTKVIIWPRCASRSYWCG